MVCVRFGNRGSGGGGMRRVLLRAALAGLTAASLMLGAPSAHAQQTGSAEDQRQLALPIPDGKLDAAAAAAAISAMKLPRVAGWIGLAQGQFGNLPSAGGNAWTVKRSISLWSGPLDLDATLKVALPGSDSEARLRLDGKLSGSLDLGQGFKLTGADIAVVAVRSASGVRGVRELVSLSNMAVSFNKATLTGAMIAPAGGPPSSYSLDFGGATLGDLFPFLASVTALQRATLASFSRTDKTYTMTLALNGKSIVLQNEPAIADSAARLSASGEGISLSDFLPEAGQLPFVSRIKLDKLTIGSGYADVSGTLNSKALQLTVDTGKVQLTGQGLVISDLIDALKGLPLADRAAFASLDADADTITIKGTDNGKAVTFAHDRKTATTVVTAADLTAADVLPELSALDNVTVAADHIQVRVKVNDATAEVYVTRGLVQPDRMLAMYFSQLDAGTVLPDAQGVLDDVALKNALFVLGLKDQSGQVTPRKLSASDLPGDLAGLGALPDGATISVSDGLAFAAILDLSKTTALTSVLSNIGIDKTQFPLSGSLSADTINLGVLRAGAKQVKDPGRLKSLLGGLNLRAPLGMPKLPGLGDLLTLSPMSLSLKGSADAAKPGLAITGEFPAVLKVGGSTLSLTGSIAFDKNFGGGGAGGAGGASALQVAIGLSQPWAEPFGIQELTIASGAFNVSLGQGGNAELTLQGLANFAGGEGLGIKADFQRTTDSGFTVKYFEFDAATGFGLDNVPGFSSLPGASEFQLDTVKLSPSGLEARTRLNGTQLNAYAFRDAQRAGVLALDLKGLGFDDLLSDLKGTMLGGIKLDNAAFVISQNGVGGAAGSVSPIAQDLMTDIFGNASTSQSIPAGLALVSKVDFKKFGKIGQALEALGVHEDSAVIMGGITGLFNTGAPSVNFSISMTGKGQPRLPKGMSYSPAAAPGFFVQWKGGEIDIGVRTAMLVKVGTDLLEFSTSVEAAFGDDGIGLKVLGSMDGTWNKPFGIQPLSLSNVKLETGIDVAGNVSLGFAGAQTFGDESMSLAGKTKFSIEAEGIPDAIAFSGTLDVLGPQTLIEIAQALVGKDSDAGRKIASIDVPFFSIKQPLIAFATPGASDPQLGLISDGFAFAGQLYFMSRELGQVKGSGSASGVFLKARIDDFTLEPIVFHHNDIDFALSVPPHFVLNSDVNAGKIFASHVAIDLTPPKFDFSVAEQFDQLGQVDLAVDVTGLDLKTGKIASDADIDVAGKFDSHLVPVLKDIIGKGTMALDDAAKQTLDADRQALDDAKKKVGDVNALIVAARAQSDRERAQVDSRVDAATAQVDRLLGRLTDDKDKIDNCGNRFTHWACKGYWELDYAATAVVKAIADGVLAAAKDVVNVAFDLDPHVLALKAEMDVAQIAVTIAHTVVQDAQDVIDHALMPVDREMSRLLVNLPLEIVSASFAGDLRSMVSDDSPLVLDLSYKLFDDARRDSFAFKLKDAEFNAKALSGLAAAVLNKAVDNVSADIPDKWVTWLKANIGMNLAHNSAEVSDQFAKAQSRYSNVQTTMDGQSKIYAGSVDQLTKSRTDAIKGIGPTDFAGPSLEFGTTYIAVAHSALCLSVAADGQTVHQENCKDTGAEQWATKLLPSGYVQLISKGLCLQARDVDPKLDQEKTQLALRSCDDKSATEMWKVVSYDGVYYQIMNRAAQKCLHFDSESAKPGDAKAVWSSCLGYDSQAFRPIRDAEKANYVKKGAALESSEGQCLWYKRPQDPRSGFNARPCNPTDSVRFDLIELPDGGIRIVDAKSGNCLAAVAQGPGQPGGVLVVPCYRGNPVTFDVVPQGQFFNLKPRGGSGNACVSLDGDRTTLAESCQQARKETITLRWLDPGAMK